MEDNYTSYNNCVEKNFGKTFLDCNRCYSLQNMTDWDMSLHSSIVSVIMAVSLFENVLFFILLLKYKELRHRTSVVSLSLLMANTGFVFAIHLQAIISTLARKWLFDFAGCQLFGFLATQSILARWLNMGVLALDRFCAVKFPFSYVKQSKYILGALLSFSWVLPVLLSTVTIKGYASVAFRPNFPSCLLYAPTINKGQLYFSFVSLFTFFVGAILPTAIYIWLLHKARTMRNSILVAATTSNTLNKERNFREQKAFFTFGIIFVAFFLTSIPSLLFQVIRWYSASSWCDIPHTAQFRVTELYLSATAIDPLIVMRSREFRKRLIHILCCHNNCGKYYANRRSIHSQIPPERNFDAVQTFATKALKLATVATSRDSIPAALNTARIPYCPRSRSMPLDCFTPNVAKMGNNKLTLSDTQLKDIKNKVQENC